MSIQQELACKVVTYPSLLCVKQSEDVKVNKVENTVETRYLFLVLKDF